MLCQPENLIGGIPMTVLNSKSLACFIISLTWQNGNAQHTEHYFAPNVNMWRDIFPDTVSREILGQCKGHSCFFEFLPGDVLPPYDANKVYSLPLQNFSPPAGGAYAFPLFGRFYPQSFLTGVATIYPQSLLSMRVIEKSGSNTNFDFNHPMAGQAFAAEINISEIKSSSVERGGRCSDWLECALDNGPGMQTRWNNLPTNFNISDPLPRMVDGDDMQFYSKPRFVHHVDSLASSFISKEYKKVIEPDDKILDLMSSVHSHLPVRSDISVFGLGLNSEEMASNTALSSNIVHDLNANPKLPFADGEFNVVLCSLSVEYLIHPQKIIKEATRVLSPGGKIIFSFSNRWFPPKVTTLWTQLHEFERMGLILEFLLNIESFSDFATISYRNWPRPAEDKYSSTIPVSDPVYILKARKQSLNKQ